MGCATKTVTEYITVEVPVKCSIEIPAKPVKEDKDITLTVIDVLEYAKKLETALKGCVQ
jgi:hypothetical protein